VPDHPLRRSTDGTQPWPDSRLTPVDTVQLAMAAYTRARIHADAAWRELDDAMRALVTAASGGHR